MKPIIETLLDCDFYKFTMQQFIYSYYPTTDVTFALTNRTSEVRLADMIDIGELSEQLTHVRTLKLNDTELRYLRGLDIYGKRMFSEAYLQFLNTLRLPAFALWQEDGQFVLQFHGSWKEVTLWETFALSIINELYYQSLMKSFTPFAKDCIIAQGRLNLRNKILKLKPHNISFIDFGTRRRFSREWQDYVVEVLKDALSYYGFRGTSNTYLAMKHSISPEGTNAHELQMAVAAIAGSDSEIRASQQRVFEQWYELYGFGLSIALTDTFGSDFFFATVPHEMIETWKGLRQDSGDPFQFGWKALNYYLGKDINPEDKLIIFSDGLNVDTIIDLHNRFNPSIHTSFGWGTNLTNDMGFRTLSLVIKLVSANGKPAVKLSDNLAKAIGPPDEIARYKKIFKYTSEFNQKCEV